MVFLPSEKHNRSRRCEHLIKTIHIQIQVAQEVNTVQRNPKENNITRLLIQREFCFVSDKESKKDFRGTEKKLRRGPGKEDDGGTDHRRMREQNSGSAQRDSRFRRKGATMYREIRRDCAKT